MQIVSSVSDKALLSEVRDKAEGGENRLGWGWLAERQAGEGAIDFASSVSCWTPDFSNALVGSFESITFFCHPGGRSSPWAPRSLSFTGSPLSFPSGEVSVRNKQAFPREWSDFSNASLLFKIYLRLFYGHESFACMYVTLCVPGAHGDPKKL